MTFHKLLSGKEFSNYSPDFHLYLRYFSCLQSIPKEPQAAWDVASEQPKEKNRFKNILPCAYQTCDYNMPRRYQTPCENVLPCTYNITHEKNHCVIVNKSELSYRLLVCERRDENMYI